MNAAVERVDMEAAFLLHARAYRETSEILEVFSHQHGRIGIVANGAKRPKSRWRGVLRPFQPLRLSWSGRGTLYTLRSAEPSAPPFGVAGVGLMSAYYLNELLIALMHRADPHPLLFAHYAAALDALAGENDPEAVLRRFEVSLLGEIGYGLVLDADVIAHEPLAADRHYEYVVDRGPVPVDADYEGDLVFSGTDLIAIRGGEFNGPVQLRAAKRLLRPILHWALGGKALRTREVLAAMAQ